MEQAVREIFDHSYSLLDSLRIYTVVAYEFFLSYAGNVGNEYLSEKEIFIFNELQKM